MEFKEQAGPLRNEEVESLLNHLQELIRAREFKPMPPMAPGLMQQLQSRSNAEERETFSQGKRYSLTGTFVAPRLSENARKLLVELVGEQTAEGMVQGNVWSFKTEIKREPTAGIMAALAKEGVYTDYGDGILRVYTKTQRQIEQLAREGWEFVAVDGRFQFLNHRHRPTELDQHAVAETDAAARRYLNEGKLDAALHLHGMMLKMWETANLIDFTNEEMERARRLKLASLKVDFEEELKKHGTKVFENVLGVSLEDYRRLGLGRLAEYKLLQARENLQQANGDYTRIIQEYARNADGLQGTKILEEFALKSAEYGQKRDHFLGDAQQILETGLRIQGVRYDEEQVKAALRKPQVQGSTAKRVLEEDGRGVADAAARAYGQLESLEKSRLFYLLAHDRALEHGDDPASMALEIGRIEKAELKGSMETTSRLQGWMERQQAAQEFERWIGHGIARLEQVAAVYPKMQPPDQQLLKILAYNFNQAHAGGELVLAPDSTRPLNEWATENLRNQYNPNSIQLDAQGRLIIRDEKIKTAAEGLDTYVHTMETFTWRWRDDERAHAQGIEGLRHMASELDKDAQMAPLARNLRRVAERMETGELTTAQGAVSYGEALEKFGEESFNKTRQAAIGRLEFLRNVVLQGDALDEPEKNILRQLFMEFETDPKNMATLSGTQRYLERTRYERGDLVRLMAAEPAERYREGLGRVFYLSALLDSAESLYWKASWQSTEEVPRLMQKDPEGTRRTYGMLLEKSDKALEFLARHMTEPTAYEKQPHLTGRTLLRPSKYAVTYKEMEKYRDGTYKAPDYTKMTVSELRQALKRRSEEHAKYAGLVWERWEEMSFEKKMAELQSPLKEIGYRSVRFLDRTGPVIMWTAAAVGAVAGLLDSAGLTSAPTAAVAREGARQALMRLVREYGYRGVIRIAGREAIEGMGTAARGMLPVAAVPMVIGAAGYIVERDIGKEKQEYLEIFHGGLRHAFMATVGHGGALNRMMGINPAAYAWTGRWAERLVLGGVGMNTAATLRDTYQSGKGIMDMPNLQLGMLGMDIMYVGIPLLRTAGRGARAAGERLRLIRSVEGMKVMEEAHGFGKGDIFMTGLYVVDQVIPGPLNRLVEEQMLKGLPEQERKERVELGEITPTRKGVPGLGVSLRALEKYPAEADERRRKTVLEAVLGRAQ